MKRFFNSHRIINIILLWTLFVSILRSIRMPNDFAKAHWLLDYRFGFMKRGLIGSLYSLMRKIFRFDASPETITIFSAIVFAGFVIALIFILFRITEQHGYDNGIVLMSLVFVSSPYIIMDAHLFGYLDLAIIVCAIISIALILSDKFIVSALVSSLAMLIHENYLLIGMPAIFFASVIKYGKSTNRSTKVHNIIGFILPILVFLLIVVFQTHNSGDLGLRKELMSYLGSFNFISTRSRLVATWQTMNFMELFNNEKIYVFERLFNYRILITFIPTLFVILFSIHSTYRIYPFNLISIFLIAVALTPMLIHLAAFDSTRISIYTIGTAFIIHWILAETHQIYSGNNYFALAAFPVLIANIFFHTKLMDKCVERFSVTERIFLYAPALALAVYLLIKQKKEIETS